LNPNQKNIEKLFQIVNKRRRIDVHSYRWLCPGYFELGGSAPALTTGFKNPNFYGSWLIHLLDILSKSRFSTKATKFIFRGF